MLGRGRPCRETSAVVKSNRPVGIAVMALSFNPLQYVPRRMANQRHSGATGGQYKSYTGVRDTARLTYRGKARRQADQSTQEGSAMRLPRMVAGDRGACVGWCVYGPWRVEAVRTG